MSTIAILQHNDLLQVVLMLDKLQEKIKASRARQWVLESCRVLLGCFAGTGQAPGRAVSNSPVGWSIEWNGNRAHIGRFGFLPAPLSGSWPVFRLKLLDLDGENHSPKKRRWRHLMCLTCLHFCVRSMGNVAKQPLDVGMKDLLNRTRVCQRENIEWNRACDPVTRSSLFSGSFWIAVQQEWVRAWFNRPMMHSFHMYMFVFFHIGPTPCAQKAAQKVYVSFVLFLF